MLGFKCCRLQVCILHEHTDMLLDSHTALIDFSAWHFNWSPLSLYSKSWDPSLLGAGRTSIFPTGKGDSHIKILCSCQDPKVFFLLLEKGQALLCQGTIKLPFLRLKGCPPHRQEAASHHLHLQRCVSFLFLTHLLCLQTRSHSLSLEDTTITNTIPVPFSSREIYLWFRLSWKPLLLAFEFSSFIVYTYFCIRCLSLPI